MIDDQIARDGEEERLGGIGQFLARRVAGARL
jgi:hypothetical protein